MNAEILQEIEKIRQEIFNSYVDKGLVSSGEFGRDLKVNDKGNRVTITAPHYVYQMEQGRKPGTFPPLEAIKQWIRDKNKTAGTNIPETAAYAIALMIKRNGINVPNKYNSGGVASDVLNAQRVERLIIEMNKIVKAKILNILA